jgi:hypothetical protein
MATPKKETSFAAEASGLGQPANGAGQAQQAAHIVHDKTYDSSGVTIGTRQFWVTGTFTDRASAERAYNLMLSRGYDEKEINLMMSNETRKQYFSDENATDTELGNKALESAGVGGAIGITAGAIFAALAAIGTSIAIPGLGLVIAGPVAAALAGAGAGGLTGGIIGALIGWGIPEERAKLYEADLKNGGIVLGVNSHNDEDAAYFESMWKGYNGRNIYR